MHAASRIYLMTTGQRRHFDDAFKEAAVKRLFQPGAPSRRALAEEIGICSGLLQKWIRKFRDTTSMNSPRSTNDWTLEEQLKLLIDYAQTPENEQGAFLRKYGVKSTDIIRFQEQVSQALVESQLRKKSRGRPGKDPEVAALEKKLEKSQKELRRKDKALAETTARLVLQKKSRLLFGELDEELD